MYPGSVLSWLSIKLIPQNTPSAQTHWCILAVRVKVKPSSLHLYGIFLLQRGFRSFWCRYLLDYWQSQSDRQTDSTVRLRCHSSGSALRQWARSCAQSRGWLLFQKQTKKTAAGSPCMRPDKRRRWPCQVISRGALQKNREKKEEKNTGNQFHRSGFSRLAVVQICQVQSAGVGPK